MTPQMLYSKITADLKSIDSLIARAEYIWNRYLSSHDEAWLDGVAMNIQNVYTSVEHLFLTVAEHVDKQVPAGSHWHAALIIQMSLSLHGVRSPVISAQTHSLLDEFRGFRHIVRNVYTYSISPEKIGILMGDLPQLSEQLTADIQNFFTDCHIHPEK